MHAQLTHEDLPVYDMIFERQPTSSTFVLIGF